MQDLVGLSPFLLAKDSECLDRVCGFSVQPTFKRVTTHFIYFIPATVQSSKTGSHSSFRTWTCFSFFSRLWGSSTAISLRWIQSSVTINCMHVSTQCCKPHTQRPHCFSQGGNMLYREVWLCQQANKVSSVCVYVRESVGLLKTLWCPYWAVLQVWAVGNFTLTFNIAHSLAPLAA